MKRTTYTKEAAAHAKVLIENGWSNEAIKAVGVCADIPFSMLRQWRYRAAKKNETANETPAETNETLKCNAETHTKEATIESGGNPLFSIETSVSTVSETLQSVTRNGFFARHFSRMDAVFYVATGTACFAFWNVAPGIPGVCFAVLYWLLAFDALQRVKAAGQNEALAESAKARVWGLEAFAAVAHWNLVNEYLWSNLDKLPFEVKQVPDNGVWILDYSGAKTNAIWQNGEFVSMVAALLACSICAAVIVAVGTTFLEAKNQSKSQSKN